MSDVTVLHNPKCSTSRAAVETIAGAGVAAEVHQYLKAPLDEAALRELIGKLEDEPTDLVRRDSFFSDQGLTDADVATVEQVVAVLVEHPRLMQRPVVIKGDRAIIGRPKDRVAPFVRG
ncbi:ArsC/Spx/MgsR family protein [Knoellia subterranea]|uniref:Arsenate reductase n=1 Tax=Knoellia subterranea KCTC 19937 TaxID=1385521 RepID=A0A0A0JRG9_9MICO|nr:ArsC/Spx/MgsR family protein [Knoellia subterranea]KGN38196.1 arsenate reductase [Knoellia subterranea KCTC 19937]